MWFNLQISTFIVGVLCSLRNQGNSAFSPISFMHTKGCIFCICFFLGSKSQPQRCFSSPLLWDHEPPCAWHFKPGGLKWNCCSREPCFWGLLGLWWVVDTLALMGFFFTRTALRGIWIHPPHCRGHGGSRSCKTPLKMWDEPSGISLGLGRGWCPTALQVLFRNSCENTIKQQQTFLPPSNQHLWLTSSLTSALLEWSHGHLSILPQALTAPCLNSTSTNHFWGGGSLVLVPQAYFRVSTS